MVNYKVRAFYEKDTGSVGADLIIYSDTGDVIDTLLITTQGQYNELVSRLDGIDQQYLDLNELKQYLQNTGDTEITINATKLNGLTVDDFARQNHNHDDLYARINHAAPQATYGLGAPDQYGHNKVIDNCNQTMYRSGESLSAYQGKLLSDRINNHSHPWKYVKINDYGALYVNEQVRLVEFAYYRENYSFKDDTGVILHYGKNYPGSLQLYKPVRSIKVAAYNAGITGSVDSEGNITVRSDKKATRNINISAMWHY